MSMPEFTANASLYRSTENYLGMVSGISATNTVIPQSPVCGWREVWWKRKRIWECVSETVCVSERKCISVNRCEKVSRCFPVLRCFPFEVEELEFEHGLTCNSGPWEYPPGAEMP